MRILLSIFFAALSTQPALALIYPTYRFDGNPLGVMDLRGREIIPARYSSVRYLGHGMYLMREIAPGLNKGKKLYLYNYAGKLLAPKLPSDCEFAGVHSFGRSAAKEPAGRRFTELPKDALVVFEKDTNFGLCDVNGSVVLPPSYGMIESVNGGLALIFKEPVGFTLPDHDDGGQHRTGAAYYFDEKEKTLRQLSTKHIAAVAPEYSEGRRSFLFDDGTTCAYGFLDAKGQIAIAPRFRRITEFEHGLAIVSVGYLEDSDRFVVNRWGQKRSPDRLFIHSRCHEFFKVYSEHMNMPCGFMNEHFEWVSGPGWHFETPPEQRKLNADESAYGVSYKLDSDGRKKYQTYLLRPVTKSSEKASRSRPTDLRGRAYPFLRAVTKNGLEVIYPDEQTLQLMNIMAAEDAREAIPLSTQLEMAPRIAVTQCEPDRYIMHEPAGTVGFDSTCFKRPQPFKPSALELFARFLQEYDLFKMTQAQVCHLLQQERSDDPDVLRIVFQSGGCSPSSMIGLEIHFVADHVASWNFMDGMGFKSESVTEDVVLVPEPIKYAADELKETVRQASQR